MEGRKEGGRVWKRERGVEQHPPIDKIMDKITRGWGVGGGAKGRGKWDG